MLIILPFLILLQDIFRYYHISLHAIMHVMKLIPCFIQYCEKYYIFLKIVTKYLHNFLVNAINEAV